MNNSTRPGDKIREISLPMAALTAGIGYLLTPTPFAEFYVFPSLVVSGDIDKTVVNILAHQGLFLAGIFCYLISFICDVVIAWSLYFLLKPVDASLSLLAAWFQLVYTAVAFSASLNLVTVFRLLKAPEYASLFLAGPLHAQVGLLLGSFRSVWAVSFVFFGIHLGLVGFLIYRSGYIPRIVGILLAVAGLGYIAINLSPYLFPDVDLGFLPVTLIGELVFMFWLLIAGWRIKVPNR